MSGPDFSVAVPPSGYRWWYLDGLSTDGQRGLTVIAFVGSVFSPYYASARRRQGEVAPERFCAINVALYGPDRTAWAMTERSDRTLTRGAQHFTLGPSALHWDGTTLTVAVEEVTVPWPRRLRGEIRFTPSLFPGYSEPLTRDQAHLWTPIAPRGHLEVAFANPALQWEGHGYLDSNSGATPLESAFRQWTWARGNAGDRTFLCYDAERRNGEEHRFMLEFDGAGRLYRHPCPPRHGLKAGLWGVPLTVHGDEGYPPRLRRRYEDTPFYNRSEVETTLQGERLVMVNEGLDLDRFKSRWVQTLLPFRMPRRA